MKENAGNDGIRKELEKIVRSNIAFFLKKGEGFVTQIEKRDRAAERNQLETISFLLEWVALRQAKITGNQKDWEVAQYWVLKRIETTLTPITEQKGQRNLEDLFISMKIFWFLPSLFISPPFERDHIISKIRNDLSEEKDELIRVIKSLIILQALKEGTI